MISRVMLFIYSSFNSIKNKFASICFISIYKNLKSFYTTSERRSFIQSRRENEIPRSQVIPKLSTRSHAGLTAWRNNTQAADLCTCIAAGRILARQKNNFWPRRNSPYSLFQLLNCSVLTHDNLHKPSNLMQQRLPGHATLSATHQYCRP